MLNDSHKKRANRKWGPSNGVLPSSSSHRFAVFNDKYFETINYIYKKISKGEKSIKKNVFKALESQPRQRHFNLFPVAAIKSLLLPFVLWSFCRALFTSEAKKRNKKTLKLSQISTGWDRSLLIPLIRFTFASLFGHYRNSPVSCSSQRGQNIFLICCREIAPALWFAFEHQSWWNVFLLSPLYPPFACTTTRMKKKRQTSTAFNETIKWSFHGAQWKRSREDEGRIG